MIVDFPLLIERILYELHELNTLSILVRLVLAVLLSGLIGLEREKNQHPAGFRTHMLVGLASALVMMTNLYMYHSVAGGQGDPVRMAAQVISGIGFLGAGTILITGGRHNRIRGLTTAASLWTSACIGLAVGSGFYLASIVASLLMFLVVTIMGRVSRKYRHALYTVNLYIELEEIGAMRAIIQACREAGYRIVSLNNNRSRIGQNRPLTVLLMLERHDLPADEDLTHTIEALPDVLFAVVLDEVQEL